MSLLKAKSVPDYQECIEVFGHYALIKNPEKEN